MNWIFPIAGKGKRVRQLGSFKPFIKIKNKTILELFFLNLKNKIKPGDKFYFITTLEHEKKNKVKSRIKKILHKIKINNNLYFRMVANTPNGPAITVLNIVHMLNHKKPCTIINPDQIIDFEQPKKIKINEIYIPLHFNSSGNSSYVRIDNKGQIKEILEKNLISFYASSGVYIFGSTIVLKKCYEKFNFKKRKKEIFLSDIINNYLKKNRKFAKPCNTYMKYDLGDVSNIKYYTKLMQKKN